jgi:hypothetical protein
MHRAIAALAALLAASSLLSVSADAKPAAKPEFLARDSVVDWMDTYRAKPEPARLPSAVRVLSRSGALKEPESSGFYIGFIAGVLGANPKMAESLVTKMLPLPPPDQWAIVRAIAYSGLPDWQGLLRRVAGRLPARQQLIQQYVEKKLPILTTMELDRDPTWGEKVKMHFGQKLAEPEMSFAKNPELLDTLWGQYFATGDYRPIWRILTLLPWSKDKDSVDRLTVGSMAKVTLANNAARYPDLLAMLRDMGFYQEPAVSKILTEVIEAAESSQAPRVRKQQLASIDELKRKGPNYRRDVALWGQVGQGAIALGCIAAAAASLTTLGLPCVVGGAMTSAALNYWASQ